MPDSLKIVPGKPAQELPSSHKPNVQRIPILQRPPEDYLWSWSFRFWKDHGSHFQVGQQDSHWFFALIERLRDLSSFKLSNILENNALKEQLRFHPINWHQKNIPIQRKDLLWIDSIYRDNPEIEFYQFQLSKACGRIVGFFDEKHVFNIVLLDPMHNIQPSKIFNYRVRPTHPAYTPFDDLYRKVLVMIKGVNKACPDVCKPVAELSTGYSDISKTFEFVAIDYDLLEPIERILEHHKYDSPEDAFVEIIFHYLHTVIEKNISNRYAI